MDKQELLAESPPQANFISGGNASSSSAMPSTFHGSDSPDVSNTESEAAVEDIHSTSAILGYCSRVILTPYHYFLTFLGWRPISTLDEDNFSLKVMNVVYLIFVILITISGFVLQGILCYRRDGLDVMNRGNDHLPTSTNTWSSILFKPLHESNCDNNYIGFYIIFLSTFPMGAFLYTLYLFRFSEYEQLHILMEKAFIQTHQSLNFFTTQPKLCRIIWIFLIGCILWVLISCITQGLHVELYLTREEQCPCFENTFKITKACEKMLVIVMLATTLFHDITFMAVFWSYGIQCELLISLMKNLCERIRNQMHLQDAIKDIEECNKFVRYLNDEMSIPIGILTLYSAIQAVLGFIYLMKPKHLNVESESVVFAIVIWMSAFVFPVVQAARLSSAYDGIRDIGLYVRCRPFGYQHARRDELDSFLLYTSTLKTKVKLFHVPVNGGVITLGFAVCVVIIFVVGELDH